MSQDQEIVVRLLIATLDEWCEVSSGDSKYNGTIAIGALAAVLRAVCEMYNVPLHITVGENKNHELH